MEGERKTTIDGLQVSVEFIIYRFVYPDNFHILYHNVINMSPLVLLISQNDKTYVDVPLSRAPIYQKPTRRRRDRRNHRPETETKRPSHRHIDWRLINRIYV